MIETEFIKLWNLDEFGLKIWCNYNNEDTFIQRIMTKEEILKHL